MFLLNFGQKYFNKLLVENKYKLEKKIIIAKIIA